MSFLRINGYQVLCVPGSGLVPVENMKRRDYSPNGIYQLARNTVGRRWRFTTIALPRDEALALADMVNHRGDGFTWAAAAGSEGIDTTAASFYSNKRRAPTSSVATVHTGYAADGARCYDERNNPFAPFTDQGGRRNNATAGVVFVDRDGQNLLLTVQALPDGDFATGTDFTPTGGATLADEPTHRWKGGDSLKITPAAAGDGARTTGASGAATAAYYVGSVWVKPTVANQKIDVAFYETAAFASKTSYTLGADIDAWYRLVHKNDYTGGAPASSVNLAVRADTGSGTDAFYIDGLQVEHQANSFPTAFISPASGARGAGLLKYDQFMSEWAALTINAWVKHDRQGDPVASNPTHYIVDAGDGSWRVLFGIDSADKLTALVRTRFVTTGSDLQVTNSGVLADGWRMATLTYDPAAPLLSLYVDGVLIGTDATSAGGNDRHLQMADLAGDVYIGRNLSTSTLNSPGAMGPIDFYPFAAPLEMVAGWYNANEATGDDRWPGNTPLRAYGDFLEGAEESVQVYGEVTNVTNVPHHDPVADAWDNSGKVIEFTLHEAIAR